jgi:hypothetical protein
MVFWRRILQRKFERQRHDFEPRGFGQYSVERYEIYI